MASRKLKRPSSARRNIKQESFSPFVSCSRLRRIQGIINDSSDNVDAVLCILGIDSRYNEGSRELINYLLFGFFDVRRMELEKSGYPDEIIEDLIFVIKSDHVHIYCNPVNYRYLLPYIGSWRNLRIHCLRDDQYDDNEDVAEDFKVHSFISMVKDCKTIGIPLFRGSDGSSVAFDKMLVEKWPIVQAFALEDFGGGGFFTMQHGVMDISEQISKLYGIMDPVALESLATEQLPLFDRQWNTLLSLVDAEARNHGVGNITETRICEPFKSFFNHGRVGDHSRTTRIPFVHFGVNTVESKLDSGQSSDTTLAQSGVSGKQAQHMICQAVSTRSPISCTRSYFFGLSHTPYPDMVNMASPGDKDLKLLNQLYAIMVEVVLDVLPVYASTLSAKETQAKATAWLQQKCAEAMVQASVRKIKFSIEAYDHHGKFVLLEEGKSNQNVKTASLTLYDIPSLDHSGRSLGSLSFAESFLESAIYVAGKGNNYINGQYTVLTAHIPRYATWNVSKAEVESMQKAANILKSPDETTFGKLLLHNGMAEICSTSYTSGIEEGTLHIFEEAILFAHSRYGCICIPKDKLDAINYYDANSSSMVALLILTYNVDVRKNVPCHLLSSNNQLMISMSPKTKAYKDFFSEVLHLWKDEKLAEPLEILETLPTELQVLHRQLQLRHEINSSLPTASSPLKKAEASLPDLHRLLDHLAVSSIGRCLIPESDLLATLNEPYDKGSFDQQEELVITIIAGVPGSYREQLAQTLTNLNKEQQRWMVLRHPIESIEMFDPTGLQQTLSSAVQTLKKKPMRPGISRKKMRALLVTPGYTDIVTVVSAIYNHPDKEVSKHLRIGSVTTCVDPLNLYMENRVTIPKVLDQCSQGWANNILFTGSTNLKNPDLEEAQSLIRAVNSEVAFTLADKGAVTRSPDIEMILSETAFNENEMIRARHLLCPGWWNGSFNTGNCPPTITEIRLGFSQPLEKNKFVSRLRSLRNNLNKQSFNGNIYAVRAGLHFSDFPARKIEVNYISLSNSLHMSPVEMQPTPPSAKTNGPTKEEKNVVIFTGCNLEESPLKDWLRGCGKQKPEKKIKRTKKSLTVEERKNIQSKHHLDPLPAGWFYNGHQYVSLMSDKQDIHPDIDTFIEQYLDEMNVLVDEYNAKIDAQEFPDLFS